MTLRDAIPAPLRAYLRPIRVARDRLRNRLLGDAANAGAFFDGGEDPRLRETELGRYFVANTERTIDKWHHYFELYERYLTPFRHKPIRMLEIGVQNGGSLMMWRTFFGPDAVLYGVDIDDKCAVLDGEAGRVRVGSQDDPAFLRDVVAEMGGIDVVIDDGSHHSRHIRTSFETLFPLLSPGGVYLIEDLHAAYWRTFGGGYGQERSFIEYMKRSIDDMHRWYHTRDVVNRVAKDAIFGIHFHDSVVVVEKRVIEAPRRSARGSVASVSDGALARMAKLRGEHPATGHETDAALEAGR